MVMLFYVGEEGDKVGEVGVGERRRKKRWGGGGGERGGGGGGG